MDSAYLTRADATILGGSDVGRRTVEGREEIHAGDGNENDVGGVTWHVA